MTKKNYWMFCDWDPSFANWILYESTPKRILRERYIPYQCQRCQKVDELAAVGNGVDDDVKIRSRRPITRSYDNFFCISSNFLPSIEGLIEHDVKLVPTPDNRFWVIVPRRFAKVRRIAESGMRVIKPCPQCQRPRECKCWPVRSALVLPRRPFHICFLWPSLETTQGRSFLPIVSEQFASVVRNKRIPGIRFSDLS
jgi:hypothetical protein